MTDTEKKIAEIREALARATPRWHDNGNEIVSLDNPRVVIGGFLRDEDNCSATNSQGWLRFLLDELDSLRESLAEWVGDFEALRQDRDRLRQERDKLIEGLRWYADKTNYVKEVHHFWHGTLIEPAEAIYYDGGQRARDILHEIGVTAE